MARAPYKVEIESEFNRLAAEEAGHQNLTEYYKSLLTGAAQTAQSYAQTQYQAQAQTAAEQASYDISGAYANYLKQQRNIAAQGRLESGYKEEIGDVLQQQYQSAYGQARAAQASALTSAKKTAQDLYSDIYGELSKSATAQIESIEKQSKTKANLANLMIEQAQLSGDKTFDWFTVNKEGKTVLSDWGYDQMSKYLMSETSDFGKYLQDKGLEEELKYYLSDPTGVRKELFGITETGYDPLSEESYKRRFSATGVDKTGQLVTYVDTLQRPTLDLNWNDFSNVDFGKSGQNKFVGSSAEITKYATTQLGLTEEEILEALSGGRSHFDKPTDLQKYLEQQAKNIRGETVAEEKFNEILTKLETYAKSKYTKE